MDPHRVARKKTVRSIKPSGAVQLHGIAAGLAACPRPGTRRRLGMGIATSVALTPPFLLWGRGDAFA